MGFNDIFNRVVKFTSDNSPAILTGMAVAGTVATAYLTGRATFKAAEIISQGPGDWDNREIIEETWQLYIPPVVSAATTITCIVMAHRIGTRRAAAMAAAFALSEKAFEEYQKKVVEKLGAKKEQAARDEIAQERVKANPKGSREVIVVGGEVLCYEAYTGRYFTSRMEDLKRAQNKINHQVNNDYYASLTDFYNEVGLSPTSMSDEVGWNVNKLLELEFSAVIADDGSPCISIEFKVEPIRGYARIN